MSPYCYGYIMLIRESQRRHDAQNQQRGCGISENFSLYNYQELFDSVYDMWHCVSNCIVCVIVSFKQTKRKKQ